MFGKLSNIILSDRFLFYNDDGRRKNYEKRNYK